jgi:hypothetical protein
VKDTAASPDTKGKGSNASATPDPNDEGSGTPALEAWALQGPHEVTDQTTLGDEPLA